ncbi:hypothetical protein Tco_1406419 [Tanacetum coccineum]
MKKTTGQLVKSCVCEVLSVKGRGHSVYKENVKGAIHTLLEALEHVESLVREENMGFDLVRCYLCPSFIKGGTTRGVVLRVANSHTGNHREDDVTSLETIRRLNPFGYANLTTFVVMCKAYDGEPTDEIPHSIHENPLYQLLGRHPVNVRTFPDPILFLSSLKPSWEHGQQRPAFFVGEKGIYYSDNLVYYFSAAEK